MSPEHLVEQFLWAPQQPYGRADWDLIFREFYDVGLADINDRDDLFESDDLIMGAGVAWSSSSSATSACGWTTASR